MKLQSLIAVVVAGSLSQAVHAQAPQFRWKVGQTLTYRVSQATTATESLKDSEAMTTTTQLNLDKRWQVLDVDAAGTATLQMTLLRLRMETRPPKGDAMLFDSANPSAGTAGLKEEMAKYIGPPLTVVRIDARGQLLEVKESKFGPPSRLQADLPFKLVLPLAALSAGQSWERPYTINLEPPQGAGETFDAVQKLTCKSSANGIAAITVATELKNVPEAAAERLPLLPLLPSGELSFDAGNGRLRAVRYQFQHDLPGHRGEGSKYQFKSTYTEDLVEVH